MDWDFIGVIVDAVGVVISVAIAIIGTMIADRQLKGEQREREEKKREDEKRAEEKRSIAEIMKSLEEASKCERELDSFINEIYQKSHSKTNSPDEFVTAFANMLDKYEELFSSIKAPLADLYAALIINEDRFPMAHGYGRYIEDLRIILDFDRLRREVKNAGYDHAMYKFVELNNNLAAQQATLSPSKLDEGKLALGELANVILESFDPLREHSERISAVIRELKIKYGSKSEREVI